MKKIASTIFCAALLAGCAATGPKYNAAELGAVPAGKSQIVLYRPFALGGGSNPEFIINGSDKCPSLPVNSFLIVTAPAGKVSVTEKAFLERETKFQMNTKGGKRYFVRTQPNEGGAGGVGVAFGAIGGAIGGAIDGASHPDFDKTGRFSFDVLDQEHIGNTLGDYSSAGRCG